MTENLLHSLLKVEELKKYYPLYAHFGLKLKGYARAVDKVSFSIQPGRVFALVGESGSGKTTVAKCIVKLIEPTSGKVFFKEQELTLFRGEKLKKIRKEIQLIFQDPYSSLNPGFTVQQIIAEGLVLHTIMPRKEIDDYVAEMLILVGLDPLMRSRYPNEFSGGQRQRIAIARAIAMKPSLIIADEPVSALDPSLQSQIINLLIQLQQEMQLTCLLISHELNIVYYLSNTAAVMYAGKIVEMAPTKELFDNPLHPYTKLLISSVPPVKPGFPWSIQHSREENSSSDSYSKCPYSAKCPHLSPECAYSDALREVSPDHFILCEGMD